MHTFICMDDSPLNNGWAYQEPEEVMFLDNDGVWKMLNEEKRLSQEQKEKGLEAIKNSLSKKVENRNGNFNCTNQ